MRNALLRLPSESEMVNEACHRARSLCVWHMVKEMSRLCFADSCQVKYDLAWTVPNCSFPCVCDHSPICQYTGLERICSEGFFFFFSFFPGFVRHKHGTLHYKCVFLSV